MKLIVGLGNPGKEYHKSRHNVGFGVVDLLARRWQVALDRRRYQGQFGSGVYATEKVLLLKPRTYMNRSGGSVAEALAFYKLELSELLVVLDDMDLELSRLRLRRGGSAGGHNGLQDIIDKLGSPDFARLRLGIGAAEHNDAVAHVLGRFDAAQEQKIEEAIETAADAVECWISQGIDEAMNRFNRRGSEVEE